MDSTRPRIAIATCAGHDELKGDEPLLREALAECGVEAPSLVWDEEAVDWGGFDACLIRSTWDYHEKHERFLVWTGEVASATRLWNPPGLVAWNSEKSYLRKLAEAGVPTVPTAWLAPGDDVDIGALLESRGWDEVVVKPAIDLGARHLKRARGPAKTAATLRRALARGEAMLQPYLPSLETEGELSLVFIDGDFTHAVRKLPAPGDFRVQGTWGGTAMLEQPSPIELEIAAEALDQLPEALIYARVDLVSDLDGNPALIELELIEPNLYLVENPAAAEVLAQAIAARLEA